MEKNTRLLVGILVLIIAILIGILIFIFVIKPTINGYIITGQNQGFEFAITSIIQLAAPPNCQTVPLIYQNQTTNVVSVECLQASQTKP